MFIKLLLYVIFLTVVSVVAYRFGIFARFFGQDQQYPAITEITNLPTITPQENLSGTSSAIAKETSPGATIKLLETPKIATVSRQFLVRWFVDSPKIATISHTAAHFGNSPRPDAKFPSDYPEKSAILKGTIPATFSAQLLIFLPGTYYLRTHAIVENKYIWSDEKTILVKPASPSATPKP